MFVSGQAKLGLLYSALVAGCIVLKWALGVVGNVLSGVLYRLVGIHQAVTKMRAKAEIRSRYWVVLGFAVGLLTCAIWTPSAVLKFFHSIRG